ncbi:hypothetical protein H1D32_03320 [Anaerobacillus sp. CMMVII]|uniref:DUF6773 family protein n=1 Tax=Anaerobacillus sp. CMMVII TaxID=2755588 RepID=UPI0021B71002|nr:DUF6773 family protein [Anaerobacillus sp. CMMVII]MCT8136867.1 hypothetical protein [Anaerobacillus sp. CMMVII]
MSMKEFFLKESSDERVVLINKTLASRGFYLLLIALVISNIVKAFFLELDKGYWWDIHILLLVVGSILVIMVVSSGVGGVKNIPKAERKRSKIISSIAFALGVVYSQFTNGSVYSNLGIVGVIAIFLFGALFGLIAYGIITLLHNKQSN